MRSSDARQSSAARERREHTRESVIYGYLLYGLAFLALGLILSLQALMPTGVLPRRHLWPLAAFGLLHGTAEWLVMASTIESASVGGAGAEAFRVAGMSLAILSFAVLGQFAVEWRIEYARWPSAARAVPGALLVLWGALCAATGSFEPAARGTAEAVGRYLLAFPLVLLAASDLRAAASNGQGPRSRRVGGYLTAAAVAFAAYAILAGLVVPPAPFWPASLVNTETFRSAVGVPVILLRASCALTVAVALSLALVVEAARARAERERLREEFISVVAHDLRAPVHTIGLHVEALENFARERAGAAELRQRLPKVRAILVRLRRMIDDLLDASLVEAKRLTLHRESVDLSRLVEEAVGRASALTAGREVRVVHGAKLPRVSVDPQRIEQILVNLLSNAVKYASADSTIVVALAEHGDDVLVSMTNRGPGIPAEEQALLFQRFYRSKDGTERARGLGLGLYIVKGLVEAHGGHVWLESAPGDGNTTVHFTVPRDR